METAQNPAPEVTQPVIRMVPRSDLYVPDWNPRKYKNESEMQDLMAFMKSGRKPPRIITWKGESKSPFAIIEGQRRFLAAGRLGWAHMEVEEVDCPLEEAKLRAITSNKGSKPYWLDDYESWEPYLATGLGLTEDEIAAKVGVAKSWIWRARQILGVLNLTSRRLIREHLEQSESKGTEGDAKNKGNNDIVQPLDNDAETLKNRISENREKWQLLEKVAYPLTALWDKRSLGDVQALVEKAMPVILSREMTGPQVKGLVKWVQGGNKPEDFDPPLKKGFGFEGTQGSFPASAVGTKGVLASELKQTPVPGSASTHVQIGAAITGNILGKQIKQAPGHIANRIVPGFTRAFHAITGLFQKMGVKNTTWATFLVAFLVLWVGSFLIHQATRLIGRALSHIAYSRQVVSDQRVLNPYSTTHNPAPSVSIPNSALCPVSGSKGPLVSTSNSKLHTSNSAQVVPSWAANEADFATDIAGNFFNMSADTVSDNLEYLKNHLRKSYFPTFRSQYFGPAFFKQIGEQNLVYVFQSPQAEFLRMEGGSGVFLVKGEQTKQRDGVATTTRPVGLILQIQHHPDGKSLVEKVTELSPGEAAAQAEKEKQALEASAKGEDPLKAVNDGVKDVQGAVNTANEVESTADKTKGVLGIH